jgi:FAD/FMN-containing dehydrogenase
MSWLARRHGLACDNVVSCTVVTANGELVCASADQHPDLFWGLRGGGGNFGSSSSSSSGCTPSALGPWWVGDPDDGRSLLPALRAIGVPDGEAVRELSYLALQTRDDNIEGHSYRRYWKGHYLPELSDHAIEALLDRNPADPTLPDVSLQAYGGAIADLDDNATAFSHRRTRFEYVAAVSWTDPDEDSLRMGTAREAAAKLDRFAAGAYVNALSDEGASGVRRAYSDTQLTRLTAVKDAYDPDNVFDLNDNIAPSGY